MKRIDGYIDLCDILNIEDEDYTDSLDSFQKLIKQIIASPTRVVIKQKDCVQLVFRFSYKGESYYFKFDYFANAYNELFFEEIAKDLGIPSISYDLAKIGDMKGVISKDFKKKDATYISGLELLRILPGATYKTVQECCNLNSLDNIWTALEMRYRNRYDKEKVVQDLMLKIVKMFILDMLVGGGDRNLNNWMIIEYPDGKVDLQPLYDNIRIFIARPESTKLSMIAETYENQTSRSFFQNSSLAENLAKFLAHSSEEFIKILTDSLNVLDKDNIDNIIKRIEEKIQSPLPSEMIAKYRHSAKDYLHFMKNVLNGIHETNKKTHK